MTNNRTDPYRALRARKQHVKRFDYLGYWNSFGVRFAHAKSSTGEPLLLESNNLTNRAIRAHKQHVKRFDYLRSWGTFGVRYARTNLPLRALILEYNNTTNRAIRARKQHVKRFDVFWDPDFPSRHVKTQSIPVEFFRTLDLNNGTNCAIRARKHHAKRFCFSGSLLIFSVRFAHATHISR